MRERMEVYIRAHEFAPGFSSDDTLLQMRVIHLPDRQRDRALSMLIKKATDIDYTAAAFVGFAQALKGAKTTYLGGTHCSSCVSRGKCEMEGLMRAEGISEPYCAAGKEFELENVVSIGRGDEVECLDCGRSFVLDNDTFTFDHEAEWVICPHCERARDVGYYLDAKQRAAENKVIDELEE